MKDLTWNPSLHPRGRDGKFIEKGAILNIFEGVGFSFPSARGEAIGASKDPDGNTVLMVEVTQPGFWHGTKVSPGETLEVSPKNLETAKPAKAKLPSESPEPQNVPEAPAALKAPQYSKAPKQGKYTPQSAPGQPGVKGEKTHLTLVSDPGDEGPKHNKQYDVVVEGNTVTTSWGPIGGAQKSVTATYDSPAEAKKAAAKKISDKIKKGYSSDGTQTYSAPAPAPTPEPAPTPDVVDAPEYDPAADEAAAAQFDPESGMPLSVDPISGEEINYGQVVVAIDQIMEAGKGDPLQALEFAKANVETLSEEAMNGTDWEIAPGVSVDPSDASHLYGAILAAEEEGAQLSDILDVAAKLVPEAADWGKAKKVDAPEYDPAADEAAADEMEDDGGYSEFESLYDSVVELLDPVELDKQSDAVLDAVAQITIDNPGIEAPEVADILSQEFGPEILAPEPDTTPEIGPGDFMLPGYDNKAMDDYRSGWEGTITLNGTPLSDPADIEEAAQALGIRVDEMDAADDSAMFSLPDEMVQQLADSGAASRSQGGYEIYVDGGDGAADYLAEFASPDGGGPEDGWDSESEAALQFSNQVHEAIQSNNYEVDSHEDDLEDAIGGFYENHPGATPEDALDYLEENGMIGLPDDEAPVDETPGEVDIAQEGYEGYSAWVDEALASVDETIPDEIMGEVLDELEAIYLEDESVPAESAMAQVKASRPELFSPDAPDAPDGLDLPLTTNAPTGTPESPADWLALDADSILEGYAPYDAQEAATTITAIAEDIRIASMSATAEERVALANLLHEVIDRDEESWSYSDYGDPAIDSAHEAASEAARNIAANLGVAAANPGPSQPLQAEELLQGFDELTAPTPDGPQFQSLAYDPDAGTTLMYTSSLEDWLDPEWAQYSSDVEAMKANLGDGTYPEDMDPEDYDAGFVEKYQSMHDMAESQGYDDPADYISDVEMMNGLGGAISEQLDAILGGEPLEDQNSNALAVIADNLESARSPVLLDLAMAIREYLDAGASAMEASKAEAASKKADSLDARLGKSIGPGKSKVWSAAINAYSTEYERMAFVEGVADRLEQMDDSGLPDEIRTMLKDWYFKIRTENPEAPDIGPGFVDGVTETWLERNTNRLGHFKAVDPQGAVGIARPDSWGGKDKLSVFPTTDPRDPNFGFYEVWSVKDDGSKSGGHGNFPDQASADAYIAEVERLTNVLNGVDPSITTLSDEQILDEIRSLDDGKPHYVDGSEGEGPIRLRGLYNQLLSRGWTGNDINAQVKQPLPETAGDTDFGTIEPDAPEAPAAPAAPEAPKAASKAAPLLRAMGKSAVNKGIDTQEGIDAAIDEVLKQDNPAAAHASLAALMTRLKLGGKQRKRYREILDQHLGLTPAEGAAATAESLSDGNPLKEKLAAKANAPEAPAEAPGETPPGGGAEPQVNGLLHYVMPDGGVQLVRTGGTAKDRNETFDVYDSQGRKVGTIRASTGTKSHMSGGKGYADFATTVTKWSFHTDPSLMAPGLTSEQRKKLKSGVYADSRNAAVTQFIDILDSGGEPYKGGVMKTAPPSKQKVKVVKNPPKPAAGSAPGAAHVDASSISYTDENGVTATLTNDGVVTLDGPAATAQFKVGDHVAGGTVVGINPHSQTAKVHNSISGETVTVPWTKVNPDAAVAKPESESAPGVDLTEFGEKEAKEFAKSAEDGEAKKVLDQVEKALEDTMTYPPDSPQRSRLVMSTTPLKTRAAIDEVRVRYPGIGQHLQLSTGIYDNYGNGDQGIARDLVTGTHAGLPYAMRRIMDGTYKGMRPETRSAVIQAFMDSLEAKLGRPPGNLYGEIADPEQAPYTKGELIGMYKEAVDQGWADGDDPIVLGIPSGSEVGIPRSEVAAIRRMLYAFRDNQYDLEKWLAKWNADPMTASAAHDALRRRVRPGSPGSAVQAAGDPKKARKNALKGRVHGGKC